MSSIFGKQVRVALFGQSHAAAIGVTVDGLPAGEPVDEAELARFLQRRAPGRSELATARKEADRPRFLCGLVIGAAAIALGARFLVDNGTLIAAALGVPDSVIGLTMVALGTSLPELITAITSLIKGHGSLSLGNIIGANLFNIVLVSGASIAISPFAIPAEKTVMGGINSSLVIDLPIMLAVMAIMCLPALIKGKLQRWQGILLLCIYACFTVYQFVV